MSTTAVGDDAGASIRIKFKPSPANSGWTDSTAGDTDTTQLDCPVCSASAVSSEEFSKKLFLSSCRFVASS